MKRWGTLVLLGFFLLQLIWVDGWSFSFGPKTVHLNYPWTGMFILSLFLLFWEIRAHRQKPLPRVFSVWFVFLLAQTIFLSTFRWQGCDSLTNSLMPFALLREGSITLDAYGSWFIGRYAGNVMPIKGHLVAFYPLMPALLAIPIYILPVLSGVVPTNAVLHQLEKCTAVWIAALTVALLYKLYLSRTTSRRALLFSLIYAFGTPCFPISSQSLWQHGASCLMIVSCLTAWHHKKWGWLGFFSVLAVAARSTNGLFAVAFGIAALWQGGRRSVPRLFFGAIGPAILLLTYWWKVLGRGIPADMMRVQGDFSFFPNISVLSAMLVSPYRGILLYSPIVVFCLWGLWKAYKQKVVPGLVALSFLGALMASVWLYQSYDIWYAGTSIGPRFLFEGLTVLFYFLPFGFGGGADSFLLRWGWRLAIGVSLISHIIPGYHRWRWETISEQNYPHSVWKGDSHPLGYVLKNVFSDGSVNPEK